MSVFQPIPFEVLIKRVFHEYKQHDKILGLPKGNFDSLELLTTDALIITDTLKDYHQKFGESFLMPHTFNELHLNIISAAAERNLETLIDQTMENSRYCFTCR